MFRSAAARAAARAPRFAAAAAAAATARRTLVSAAVSAAVPRAAVRTFRAPVLSFSPARAYSAAAGLEREEVESRILSLLQGLDKVDAAQLKATSHFANDLGLDSLDTVEVVMAIEEEFSIEIPDKDADSIHSVDQAVEYILKEPHAH